MDATAGSSSGRNELFSSENIVGWVNLPNMSPHCRIVRVSGDSMAPVIQDGDFVAVRELSNPGQIYWGQIYVVQLDDFRLVKYVRRHTDPNMVVLRSVRTNEYASAQAKALLRNSEANCTKVTDTVAINAF